MVVQATIVAGMGQMLRDFQPFTGTVTDAWLNDFLLRMMIVVAAISEGLFHPYFEHDAITHQHHRWLKTVYRESSHEEAGLLTNLNRLTSTAIAQYTQPSVTSANVPQPNAGALIMGRADVVHHLFRSHVSRRTRFGWWFFVVSECIVSWLYYSQARGWVIGSLVATACVSLMMGTSIMLHRFFVLPDLRYQWLSHAIHAHNRLVDATEAEGHLMLAFLKSLDAPVEKVDEAAYTLTSVPDYHLNDYATAAATLSDTDLLAGPNDNGHKSSNGGGAS